MIEELVFRGFKSSSPTRTTRGFNGSPMRRALRSSLRTITGLGGNGENRTPCADWQVVYSHLRLHVNRSHRYAGQESNLLQEGKSQLCSQYTTDVRGRLLFTVCYRCNYSQVAERGVEPL